MMLRDEIRGFSLKIWQGLIEIFKRYALSASLIVVISFLTMMQLKGFSISFFDKYHDTFLLTLVLMFSAVFALETRRLRPILHWGFISIFSMLAFLSAAVLTKKLDLAFTSAEQERLAAWSGVISLSLFPLAVWTHYRKQEKGFEGYCAELGQKFFQSFILFALGFMGIVGIAFIAQNLLFPSSDLVENTALFFAPFLAGFTSLYVFVRGPGQLNDFGYKLFIYLLLPLLLLAYVVIYLYALRMIITWTFPSNEVFSILLVLFSVSTLIWIGILGFERAGTAERLARVLPLAFLPLLALEAFALGLRVASHGLSLWRLAGVYALIFQLFILVAYIVRYKERGRLLLVGMGLGLMSICMPYVNLFDLPVYQQLNRLKSQLWVIDAETKSEEAIKALRSSYHFLDSHALKACADCRYEEIARFLSEHGGDESVLSCRNYWIGEDSGGFGNSKRIWDIEGYRSFRPVSLYEFDLDWSANAEGWTVELCLEEKSEVPKAGCRLRIVDPEHRFFKELWKVVEKAAQEEVKLEPPVMIFANERQKLMVNSLAVERCSQSEEPYKLIRMEFYLLER